MKKAALVAQSLVALLLWTAVQSTTLLAQVYINEVVASNSSGLADEEGDFPDWIELYNYTDSPISLEGYGISDDSLDLFKFTFPELTLDPGEYYIIFASDKDRVGQLFDWKNVITQGDSTKYIIPESSVVESWITNEFNDSEWLDGRFGIGYGDGDDITNVPNGTISVFTRTSFNVENSELVTGLLMKVDFDDSYVAYINGTEVHRENIEGDAPLAYNATASNFTEPMLDRGIELPELVLNDFASLITEGKNTLAIQVHNYNSGSSDLTLIPFLDLGSSTDAYHLNFKLSSEGEEIFLTSPDSSIVDHMTYPELKTGESFGRSADNDSLFYIFLEPTPRLANTADGYVGRSADPELNKPEGFYKGQVTIALADTSLGDVVRFSWDGSDPNEGSLAFGSDTRTLSKTFTLKFQSFEPGKLPSNIITKTYFKDEEHELPVVTISTHPDNLWSDESGIYVRGTNGVEGNCEGRVNWNQDWEIPVTIELYEKDKSRAFVSGAGAKIFGGCSRSNPAKSLAIYFRNEYGNTELEYKLFEEKDIDKFQAFVLRNSGNDFTSQGHSMIRDGMMKTLMEGTEIEYQAFRPAVLYINGEYWGIHNIREKVNEHFIESNSEADSDEIDLLEGNGWPIHGDDEAYNAFKDALGSADMSDPEQYQTVEDMIDIDNYTDYMAAEIYYANTDWPGNNIKYWRNRQTNGKWRWIMYDTDFGFNLYDYNVGQNTIAFALDPNCFCDWPNPSWSTYIFRRMVESDVFVEKFVNRMSDFMNTRFEAENINAVIDSLSGLIDSEIPRHVETVRNNESWGSSVTTWQNDLSTIRDFADKRRGFMETFIRERFDLTEPQSIEVDVSDEEQGYAKVNRVKPGSYPWSGTYFGGLKVPVTAIPKPGYKFIGWSGNSDSKEHTILVDPGVSLTANFEPSNGEETTIIINEIMHSSSEAFDSGDWIELYNASGYEIDISGWVLKDDDDSHEYIFPQGTELTPNGYLVVANDLDDFNNSYNKINSSLFGELGFGLSSGGDQVRLYNSTGLVIDSVEYLGESPWPTEAVGTGFSIELEDPVSDNSLAENWGPSITIGGTPGTENGVIVSKEEETELPTDIRLGQNYPNPFNPSTRINFELPKQSNVKLSVFDALGREVDVLVNGIQRAGNHFVTWNSGNKASGIYFYVLETGGVSLSKKMVLIK